jgi:hypothetical protein
MLTRGLEFVKKSLAKPDLALTMQALSMVVLDHLDKEYAKGPLKEFEIKLTDNLPAVEQPNPRWWFYGTMAAWRYFDTAAWRDWALAMRDAVLRDVGTGKSEMNSDGLYCATRGASYSAALQSMTLEIYYRYDSAVK